MAVVAIPERFGSRRFGKVSGGTLDTDGKAYPQPGGIEVWEPGSTFLVAPSWADPLAETYGFRPNALISGGTQHVYGQAISGWLFCDSLNGAVWLIQPDLAGASSDFDSPLAINFMVVRFGVFDGNGAQGKTARTATLSNWGQSSPAITLYGGCVNEPEAAELFLMSAKTDGSTAIIMAATPTDQAYQELPWIHHWPVGFIGATCTAVLGAAPTIALSVLRSRATTVGTRTDYEYDGSLTDGTLCEIPCSYQVGQATFTQGVADAILALLYHNDVLVEITGSAQIEGTTLCGTPQVTDDGWSQDSSGTVRITWSLSNGTDTVSWYYELSDAMNSTVDCENQISAWTTDQTETFNGETVTHEDVNNGTSGVLCFLKHTAADDGLFGLMINTACRAPGDLWEDQYTSLSGSPYLLFGFRRYAYGVIGLYVESNGNPVRGDCITPTGKILAASVGTGNYGAWNARTGEAVAGVTDAVGYV
jgi:hypothetical protein